MCILAYFHNNYKHSLLQFLLLWRGVMRNLIKTNLPSLKKRKKKKKKATCSTQPL